MASRMLSLSMALIASCCHASYISTHIRPTILSARVVAPIHCGTDSTSPEELLLEAIGFLKSNDVERARSNVAEARRACDSSGGPTEEQSQLIALLTARLPPPKAEPAEPTLDEMFPGTTAAPTGKSLIMPGTPSMAELAAKAKAKREQKKTGE